MVLGVVVVLCFVAAISGKGATPQQTPAAAPSATALPTISAVPAETPGTAAPAPVAPAPAATPDDDATDGSTVVYEVIGKGTASVTYSKEGFSQEQQTAARLPFRKELHFKDQVGQFTPLTVVAQHSNGGGDITCRISVDGKVVGESTSSGQYAVVTCNGNG